MLNPVYTAEDKAAILEAANYIVQARTALRSAAAVIRQIAHHDTEYDGYAVVEFRDVMSLVGEDGAGAKGSGGCNEPCRMSETIADLRKAAR
jgi:hypothetical protein